jgi:hypothetical protein
MRDMKQLSKQYWEDAFKTTTLKEFKDLKDKYNFTSEELIQLVKLGIPKKFPEYFITLK